jgi:hypothetical protein
METCDIDFAAEQGANVAVEQERSSGKRRRILSHLAAWLLLLALTPALADVDEVRRVPAPDWVVPVERGSIDEKMLGQISGGSYYLLSDMQINVQGKRSIYRRIASKAINKSPRVANTFVVRREKSTASVPGVPAEAFSL